VRAADIMLKISEGQFALGGLAVFVIWFFMVLPFLHSTPARALTTEDRLADYTLWLERYTLAVAIVTAFLVVATIALAIIAFLQWRDSRILQRAYLASEPRGLHEMTDGTTIAHVRFANFGNMPARSVRNEIEIGWSPDDEKSDFKAITIPEANPDTLLLIPKGQYERGTRNLSEQDAVRYRAKEGYVYVWGRVEYDDGFGEPRWLIFCHRYNSAMPEIPRLHDHHNDGN
jgi:hypothetical protein